jgi:hypothetical protein
MLKPPREFRYSITTPSVLRRPLPKRGNDFVQDGVRWRLDMHGNWIASVGDVEARMNYVGSADDPPPSRVQVNETATVTVGAQPTEPERPLPSLRINLEGDVQ